MKLKEDLEKLGLTKQQVKVYLKLLELGSSSVGEIVKQMDISRISCYDTLNRLISKGLVSFAKTKGHRIYQSTDPNKLLDMAKENEREAKEKKEIIKKILPELKKIKTVNQEEKEATIYKTQEGIKYLFELMLEEKKPIFIISATGKALQGMKYYFPQWHKSRERLKIPVSVIFNKELQNQKITKIPLSKIKFLSKEFSSPSTLFIFGDYIIILLWSDTPYAFFIKSREIAYTYHNYFKIIWKTAKTNF